VYVNFDKEKGEAAKPTWQISPGDNGKYTVDKIEMPAGPTALPLPCQAGYVLIADYLKKRKKKTARHAPGEGE
jgi:hypothetical protein